MVTLSRCTTSIVMNRIGSTGNKSRTSRKSQKREKSASKSRKTLINSREVYYLVLKYEQDDITKKLIENQEILRSSSRAKCIMENEFEIGEWNFMSDSDMAREFLCIR